MNVIGEGRWGVVNEMNLYVFPIAAMILLTQSIYMFVDARKNGMNYWFWGIIGLIQAPLPVIFYLLIKRSRKKRS